MEKAMALVHQDWHVVDMPTGLALERWRRDVALEMWIDSERTPVKIRVTGRLDGLTGTNLLSVMDELMAEGSCDFEIEAPTLDVSDVGGAGVLKELARRVRRWGCRFTWDGPATAGLPSVRGAPGR